MSVHSTASPIVEPADAGSHELEQLLAAPVETAQPSATRARIDGVRVGRIVALTDNGATPLVVYPGHHGLPALPARATLDLHGPHIGRDVVLMFEDGDPYRPIVVGCLHEPNARSLPDLPGQVEMDVDGKRLLVSAKEQLVLRCGKASITLTRSGKVLFHGTYASNRSSGVLRLKGGSVHIN